MSTQNVRVFTVSKEHFKFLKQSKQLQLQCTPLYDSANQSATTWRRGSVKRQARGGIELTLLATIKTLYCMQLKVTES
jgi:hypothetical protein